MAMDTQFSRVFFEYNDEWNMALNKNMIDYDSKMFFHNICQYKPFGDVPTDTMKHVYNTYPRVLFPEWDGISHMELTLLHG